MIFDGKQWFRDNISPYMQLLKVKLGRIETKICDNKLVSTDYNGVDTCYDFPSLSDINLDDISNVCAGLNDGQVLAYSESNNRWQNMELPSFDPQIQSDWTQTNDSKMDYILNKPVLSVSACTGRYCDLLETPSLSAVATSGSYNDLTDLPNVSNNTFSGLSDTNISGSPSDGDIIKWNSETSKWISAELTIQDKPDWLELNPNSNKYICNKPELASVATNGNYNSLNNKPDFSVVATSGLYCDIIDRPNLSKSACTGDYNDLKNRPQIGDLNSLTDVSLNDETNGEVLKYINGSWVNSSPDSASQVQSDWLNIDINSASYIKNKPDIPPIVTDSLTNGDMIQWDSSKSAFTNVSNISTQINSDWNETDSSSKSFILNKPTMCCATFSDSSEWVVNHNLNKKTDLNVYDSGSSEIFAEVVQVSVNQSIVCFANNQSGYVTYSTLK